MENKKYIFVLTYVSYEHGNMYVLFNGIRRASNRIYESFNVSIVLFLFLGLYALK